MLRVGPYHLRAGLHGLLIALAICTVDAARTAEAQQPVAGTPGAMLDPSSDSMFVRRQIFVGLPTSQQGPAGQVYLAPNVNMGSPVVAGPGQAQYRQSAMADDTTSQVLQANAEAGGTLDGTFAGPLGGELAGPNGIGAETLPGPDGMFTPGETAPIFSELVQQPVQQPLTGWRAWLMSKRPGSGGLGRERLAFAPFEIDVSAPNPNMRMRLVSVQGGQYPDRAEYLWARTVNGRGPKLPERNLNYQEARFLMELGSKKFSLGTEIPFRATNPDINPNHMSISDMNVATKLVMVDGKSWQVTQLFRSYFPTGSPSMGLGTGHVSFEPGFLARYNHCDTTYYHGQIKYFFPVGGDPTFSGQVFTYGVGVSKILFEDDKMSVVPTLELVGNYIANGLRTQPNGLVTNAEGDHIIGLYPGVRIAHDRGGDLGLFEWGVSFGMPITGPRFYDNILRLDVRFAF